MDNVVNLHYETLKLQMQQAVKVTCINDSAMSGSGICKYLNKQYRKKILYSLLRQFCLKSHINNEAQESVKLEKKPQMLQGRNGKPQPSSELHPIICCHGE